MCKKENCRGFTIKYGEDIVDKKGVPVCEIPVIDAETGEYDTLTLHSIVTAREVVDWAREEHCYMPG